MTRDRGGAAAGFTLIETLVAIAILLTAVGSLSQLFGLAAAANRRAVARTLGTIAARDKIEQLRSAPWAGLIASPVAALEDDVDGYSDRVGGGAMPALVRRWSIAPLPADPSRLMVLQVLVLGAGGSPEARIVTIRRKEGP